MNGCSCYGRPGTHKADIRDAALKLGALKAVARQGELSEWQKDRVKVLSEHIEHLTRELHAIEDIADQRQQ